MGNRVLVRGKSAARRDVTLRNLTASYTAEERALMRALPERERLFVHEAKALFNGKLDKLREL